MSHSSRASRAVRAVRAVTVAALLLPAPFAACGGSPGAGDAPEMTHDGGGGVDAMAAPPVARDAAASLDALPASGDAAPDVVRLADASVDAAAAVGATTPFVSYEAEVGQLQGAAAVHSLLAPPTTQYSSPELEASGHAYVSLTTLGDSVGWVNQTGMAVTAINVRYSIPDAPGGGGMTASLDLYVNGQMRQSLSLTSAQTWLYESASNYNGNDQNPADGNPRVFFDDVHVFLTGAPLAPGDTVSLQRGAANSATFYDIDVVDLEAPPPPADPPDGSLSIAAYGAVADTATADSTKAIQTCIDDAQTQGKSVWIPEGTFYLVGTTGLTAKGITIEGAGAWYSRIYRSVPLPNSVGLAAAFSVDSCHVKNFAIDSNATSRDTADGAGGAMDTTGTGWSADGIWTQHTESGFWASGTSGTVENCRLTSIWADGCNLNNVSLTGTVGTDLTARNNFVRGTGDDAIAINSVDYNGAQQYTPMSNVTIENNTSIAPWGGKGVAIYGGSGHIVRNNYMSDTARYIGLGVGKFGTNGSDLQSATVSGNVVERCGGNAYVQGQPALHIGNGGDGQGVGTVANATVSGNTIRGALYDAVGFSTSTGIIFENNVVDAPWRNGIVISPPFYPAPTGSATLTGNVVTGLDAGAMAFSNLSSGYIVTQSGNSW